MIRLEEGPEPLTEESWERSPILAESEALNTLHRQIQRYANRQAAGCSFLIAGHRGSGKTTTVRYAVQKAQLDAEQGKLKLWPILISLHGPDLLDAENADRPGAAVPEESAEAAGDKGDKEQPANGETTSAADEEPQKVNPAAAALRMLAKNLHRALADELSRGFRRQVKEIAKARPARAQAELAELAAHVEHELDHAADVADLREYWRRAEALEHGVLRAARPKWGVHLDAGQGARELTAIATAIEAFEVIAGKASRSNDQTIEDKEDRKATLGINANKELINTIAGVATGAALGVGMVMKGQSPALSALTAIASAFAATLTLNYTITRSRIAERKRTRNFTWDTSIASLDRMLPVLIERMLNAGIAPIFAVDELDKVHDLPAVMGKLITHLKHFVTEKAFFCFLCDRSYFERIVDSGRTGDYSKEYTFFSDRLFLQYTPSGLKKYLLGDSKKPDQYGILRSSDVGDETDLKFLGHVLLQSCRLSPIGLRRELNRYIDGEGNYTLGRGAILGKQGYQMRAFMQLAVEDVFGESEDATLERPLTKRMRQDSAFGRLAVDALYYPAISWADGKGGLDVSEDSFKKYLERRLNGDAEENGANASSDANGGAAPKTGKNKAAPLKPLKISPVDFDLLYSILVELLEHLRNPNNLLAPVQRTPEISGFEASLVPSFFRDAEADDRWQWSHDPFGRAITVKAAVPEPEAQAGQAPAPAPEPTKAPAPEVAAVATLPPTPSVDAKSADAPDAAPVGAVAPEEMPPPKPAGRKRTTGPKTADTPKPKPAGPSIRRESSRKPPADEGATELERSAAETQADDIAAIQAAFEPFSHSVTLDDLAQKYRILEPSPAWSSVAAAIRRVVAPRARASDLRDEIKLIDVYTRMLQSNGEIFRHALLLAIASTQSPHTGATEVAEGLGLVTAVFGLQHAPRAKVQELLVNAVNALMPNAPAGPQTFYKTAFNLLPTDLQSWLAAMGGPSEADNRASELNTYLTSRIPPLADIHASWGRFLKEHSFGFESVYDVTIDDFAQAARGLPILRAFVDDHSLGELWALPIDVDPLLRDGLLAFLGVGNNLRARQVRPEEKVLLLANDNPTAGLIARNWKPSVKHSVVMTRFQGQPNSILLQPGFWAPHWRPTLILVESSEPVDAALFNQWMFGPTIAQPQPGVPIFAVTHAGNTRPGSPRVTSTTILAASLDEAVDLAKSSGMRIGRQSS